MLTAPMALPTPTGQWHSVAWRRLGRDDADSRNSQTRDQETFSRRLSSVLSTSRAAEEADPAEVEARIRNITHGAGRD